MGMGFVDVDAYILQDHPIFFKWFGIMVSSKSPMYPQVGVCLVINGPFTQINQPLSGGPILQVHSLKTS